MYNWQDANGKTTNIPNRYLCSSWTEADAFLLQMGKNNISKQAIENEMNDKIQQIRAEYELKEKGLTDDNNSLCLAIEKFANENKDDFGAEKSKKLAFGSISYRMSDKVLIRSNAVAINGIRCMAKDGILIFEDYVHTSYQPNKDTLKRLDPGTLSRIGVTVKRSEGIKIETNYEKIRTL